MPDPLPPVPPPASASGRQTSLTSGRLRATVAQVGASVRELTLDGVAMLDGYGEHEIAAYAQGQALIPWPNRVADGRYAFAGQQHQLALTEPGNGCAIHGLARWLAWDVADRADDRVLLTTTVWPQAGYPFTVRAEVEYRLGETALQATTTLQNLGPEQAPVGNGFHPYVTAGADAIDDVRLELPAAVRLASDDRGIPTGERVPVDGTEYDFRTARPVGALELDTAFADLARGADGRARIRLSHPTGHPSVTLSLDAAYRYVMAFTGDSLPDPARRRRSLGLEPMTCAPNALRSGDGLRILEPGEAFTSVWALEFE